MIKDYQKQRIEKSQKFLLKLLHLHIGNYYPLRKYLGIDYKGKIDQISNLSIGYNTKDLGDERIQQTRTYQQPDLGYKLNLLLDKIPQLSFAIPALLQPAYGLAALAFFFLTQTVYQPSSADNGLWKLNPVTNYGTITENPIYRKATLLGRVLLYFDTSDIPDDATFSQGDLSLYASCIFNGANGILNRLTQLAWTELGSTWNTYDGSNDWSIAGGDFVTTNSVTVSVTTTGWKIWEAADLIQDCYDNQSKKVHLILKSQEDGENAYARFYSNNYTDDTDLCPKLTVTYTVSATTGPFPTFFQQ